MEGAREVTGACKPTQAGEGWGGSWGTWATQVGDPPSARRGRGHHVEKEGAMAVLPFMNPWEDFCDIIILQFVGCSPEGYGI